ncbi:MAG: hypothetical protein HYR84_00820 [Planctomycetes bacterium]|nr:hypothetical protein [Planctomycetota bacterium]
MTRAGCRGIAAYLACLLALAAPSAQTLAEHTEQRDFSIFVDGKEAGSSRMVIVQKDDGTTYMSAHVEVKFKHLVVIDYALKLDTQEWWKDGRLIGLKTNSSENNKKTEVIIAADNKQLRMRVNGRESMLNPDVWTSSYWKLADARFHNKQVPIVETDSGKEFASELKYVGAEKVPVGKELQDCYRFQVTSASGPIHLWYDKHHRLVRQEFTEQGHKTIVQLSTVRR